MSRGTALQTQSKKGEDVVNLSHVACVSEVQISMELFSCSKWLLSFTPFFQDVGHYIFKELIKKHHSTESTKHKEISFNPIYEELNGIRYAAGWVARALLKKLKRSTHPLKDDLSLCIVDLLDDEDDSPQESNDWVEAVDRGGLIGVNNITFELFWTMEKTLRDIMSTTPVSQVPENSVEKVKNDDNVELKFYLVSNRVSMG